MTERYLENLDFLAFAMAMWFNTRRQRGKPTKMEVTETLCGWPVRNRANIIEILDRLGQLEKRTVIVIYKPPTGRPFFSDDTDPSAVLGTLARLPPFTEFEYVLMTAKQYQAIPATAEAEELFA